MGMVNITPEHQEILDCWQQRGAAIEVFDSRVGFTYSELDSVVRVGCKLANLLAESLNFGLFLDDEGTIKHNIEERQINYGELWGVRIGMSAGFSVAIKAIQDAYSMKADLRNDFERMPEEYGSKILVPGFFEVLSVVL